MEGIEHTGGVVAPPRSAAQRVTFLVACVLGMLGVLGLLRAGLSDPFRERGTDLLGFVTHPLTALIHLGIGLAGIPAATDAHRSQRFAWGVGTLLGAWCLLGAVFDGSPNDMLARDLPLLALHAAGALTLVVAALLVERAPQAA